MTPKQIQNCLEIIKTLNDDELAHYYEDKLHQNVLKSIAENKCIEPQECAKLALESLKIKFNRWFA